MQIRTRALPQFMLVGMLAGGLLLGLTMSGATAGHEQVHCRGCVDKRDIDRNAVGSWEVKNGSIRKSDIGRNAVGSVEVKNGSVQPWDLSGLAKPRFAAFEFNLGEFSVLRDRGLRSAVRNARGSYTLTWGKSVANCAWTSSFGARNGAVSANMKTLSLNGGGGQPSNVIKVRAEDESGNTSDASFSVVVTC